MYRLNRLHSTENFFTLASAAAVAAASADAVAAASAAPKWFVRPNPTVRFLACIHSSRCHEKDSPPPAATSRIDDFVNVGDTGDYSETPPETESASNNSNGTYERKVLPLELSRNVVRLTCESSAYGGLCDVYLVGTVHVSSESCQEVQKVIDYIKPQVVFLELCSKRERCLAPQDFKVPTMGEMVKMWMNNHNLFEILFRWYLAEVASELKVVPGAEFRVAYEEAMKYGGKVILGDRPVHITLKRTWAKMPLWHKIKLFLPSTKDLNLTLKDLDDVKMVTLLLQKMSKHFPTLMETLVHERDLYMSATLLKVAREHNSVVAVVGKGHLPGIQKNWKQPIELKQLLGMPSEKNTLTVGKILSAVGVTVAGVAVISGLYLSIKK